MNVIDKPVAIVIDTVTRDFSRVRVYVIGEVFVPPIDTGINDTNEYLTTRFHIPRFRCIDIGIRRTACLACIVQTP